MCIVQMRVQCSEKFSEAFVGDVEQTEFMIESILGMALLEIFDTVHVEDVRVIASQNATMRMESLLPNE